MVNRLRRNRWAVLILLLLVLLLCALGIRRWLQQSPPSTQLLQLRAWFADPMGHADWSVAVGTRCAGAPMLFPTTGYIGFGWDDSFRPGHRHSGLDIFGPDAQNGVTPIVAAYDGYLTREEGWKSTLILRHPDFPAVPAAGIAEGEQIWSYYTHMASRDGRDSYIEPAFPPGTYEQFVAAGTLLGHQGNWGGSRWQLTGRHLHFSVVKTQPDGAYMDEREIANTYNPIFLLGLVTNARGILTCPSTSE